jgi:hypothetical protein
MGNKNVELGTNIFNLFHFKGIGKVGGKRGKMINMEEIKKKNNGVKHEDTTGIIPR